MAPESGTCAAGNRRGYVNGSNLTYEPLPAGTLSIKWQQSMRLVFFGTMRRMRLPRVPPCAPDHPSDFRNPSIAALTSAGRSCCVPVSRHVEGRDRHPGARPRCEQLPVPINIAIPVETAAEPGLLELAGIEIDIRLAEPGWQRCRAFACREKAAIPCNHPDAATRLHARRPRRIP